MSEIDPPERPWRPMHRAGRIALDLALPVVAVAFLLAPAVMTVATSPPVVVKAVPDRTAVIRVKPFENLTAESCTADLPLHLGPSTVGGTLSNQGALRARMTSAVARCERDWSGSVTVSVKVNEAGSVRDVRAEAGADGWLRACVIRKILREGPVESHGPGSLTIGYFRGTRLL